MSANIDTALRNAFAEVWRSTFNGGSIQIRTGAKPASGGAESGTLLCTISIPADWYQVAASGATQATDAISGSVVATGTAGHARFIGNSDEIAHTDVTENAGAGPVKLDSLSFVEDGVARITSSNVTMPSGD